MATNISRYATVGVSQGLLIGEDALHICLPLSPSRNEIDKWNYSRNLKKKKKLRADMYISVRVALRRAFGGAFQAPWCDHAVISAVRCSDANKRCDISNVIGGLKVAEDCLVTAGLLVDDGPKYVTWGVCQDRAVAKRGPFVGPATHLLIARTRRSHSRYMSEREAVMKLLDILYATVVPLSDNDYVDMTIDLGDSRKQ